MSSLCRNITNVLVFIFLYFGCNSKAHNPDFEAFVVNSKYWFEYKSQHQPINNCIIEEYGENEESMLLSDFLKSNSNTLFLWFSERSCSVCIEEEIDNLEKVAERIGIEKIVIIGEYHNKRIRWMRFTPFTVLRIIDGNLGLFAEEFNSPFYFVLDHNLSAKSVFISFKEMPKHTEAYFDFIIDQYFNQRQANY